MDSTVTGMFAESRAGHDKSKLYIIIKEETEYVYLSDGDLRPVDHPKRKNRKHIQIIKKGGGAGLAARLAAGGPVSNEEIKKAIKDYINENRKRDQEMQA